MKESSREKIRYLILGVLISFLASLIFFYFKKDYEETKQKENYNLAWTIKNDVTNGYLTKEIAITNCGNKPLHKVTLIMELKKKILFHSPSGSIVFFDSNNKVVDNFEAFKGKDKLNIHWDFFPPHTILTIKITLDEKIEEKSLKEVLTQKDSIEDIKFNSLSSDEVTGIFIKSQ